MKKHPTQASTQAAREAAILDAIRDGVVTTQRDMLRALKTRGVRAAQASVSRDIARLGLVKAAGRYVSAPHATGIADPELPLRTDIRRVLSAGPHLVVVHCEVGSAQRVGLALDRLRHPGLVGTLAGDDTVFAAMADGRSATRFVRYLQARIAPRNHQ